MTSQRLSVSARQGGRRGAEVLVERSVLQTRTRRTAAAVESARLGPSSTQHTASYTSLVVVKPFTFQAASQYYIRRCGIVTDGAGWSVGLSVTIVSPAKTAEPIETSFGLRTWVAPRNHDGCSEAILRKETVSPL